MANHFPLIINPVTTIIEELGLGDNLDLTGSGIANANTIQVTTLQFADGTTQNTAGGGSNTGGGSFLITSNVTSFTTGAGLNFAVDYADPAYPGGVWTLYQTLPIVPLYWKYTNDTNPVVTTSDLHGDITFEVNPLGTNNGIGVFTSNSVPSVNTWIFIPDTIQMNYPPYFKYDQPPFYGIILTPEGQANPDYNIHPGIATLNGVSYTGYEFFTFDPTQPQFIYTASA